MSDLDQFRRSLGEDEPPAGTPTLLGAMWHEARGDWEQAHQITQAEPGPSACWVHAYLHRREGDLSNAGYWYRRAGRPMPASSLDDEWAQIASALCDSQA